MFDRYYVHKACLIVSSQGIGCGASSNACDRTNKGEYKQDFCQDIAGVSRSCWVVTAGIHALTVDLKQIGTRMHINMKNLAVGHPVSSKAH